MFPVVLSLPCIPPLSPDFTLSFGCKISVVVVTVSLLGSIIDHFTCCLMVISTLGSIFSLGVWLFVSDLRFGVHYGTLIGVFS